MKLVGKTLTGDPIEIDFEDLGEQRQVFIKDGPSVKVYTSRFRSAVFPVLWVQTPVEISSETRIANDKLALYEVGIDVTSLVFGDEEPLHGAVFL